MLLDLQGSTTPFTPPYAAFILRTSLQVRKPIRPVAAGCRRSTDYDYDDGSNHPRFTPLDSLYNSTAR